MASLADAAQQVDYPAKVTPSEPWLFDEALNPANGLGDIPVVGGEWVKAVFEVMPYLDSQQLREALVILDRAILNTQRVKALERIAVGAQASPDDATMPQIGSAVELLRLQVWQEQRALMGQLHNLRLATQAPRVAAAAAGHPPGVLGAAGAPVPSLHMPSAAAREAQERGVRGSGAGGPHYQGGGALGVTLAAAPPALLGPRVPHGQGAPQSVAAHMPHAAPGFPQPNAAHMAAAVAREQYKQQQRHQVLGATVPHPGHWEGAAPFPGRLERPMPPQTFQQQQQPGTQVQAMTLSMSLQLLSKEDPDTLFIVRRINKLGFKAARKLKTHFSAYGQVLRVLVAHSTVKFGDSQQHQWRRRPSSLGFIHMSLTESVRRVLASGTEHEVDGCLIRVQRFERQKGEMGSEEALQAALAQEEAEEREGSEDRGSSEDKSEVNEWGPQQTSCSGDSTSTTRSGNSSGRTLREA